MCKAVRVVGVTTGLLAAVLVLPALAQSPRLTALVRGIDTPESQRPLDMAELDIEVVARGAIAETTLHVRFSNPTQEVLEGRFALELPEGAVVTGYALDVNGVMLDGVLVGQRRARAIYTDKVRQSVDPGVAEVSRDNVFTTDVYPIDPERGREVKVTFVAPVQFDHGWVLPLTSPARVGALKIDIRADEVATAPRVELPAGLPVTRSEQSGSYSLQARGRDVLLAGALRVAPLEPQHPLLRAEHASGKRFFQLADRAVATDPAAAEPPQRVRIYWDRSSSRRNAALAEEAALLQEYLQLVQPTQIDFVAFNSSGAQRTALRSAAELDGMLEHMVYRGATSFAVLNAEPLPAADLCLLFSDGVATIDARDGFAPDCQLMAVTTARDADRGYLQRCAGPQGAVLMLTAATRREVLLQLQRRRARILAVRDARGEQLDFAVLADTDSGWHIVGAAPQSGEVTVHFGLPAGGSLVRHYEVTDAAPRFNGPGALWAAHAVALLAAGDSTHARLRELSRAYSIASPYMSFLVLERVSDYVYAEVAPPASLPAEMMADYRETQARYLEDQDRDAAEHTAAVVQAWEEHRLWWREPPKPRVRKPAQTAGTAGPRLEAPAPVAVIGGATSGSATSRFEAPMPVEVIGQEEIQAAGEPNLGEYVRDLTFTQNTDTVANVLAAQDGGQDSSFPIRAPIAIELAPWQPDRPYLRALTAAQSDFERVFAEQEREHGARAAFYLDVAEWLHRKGRRGLALEVLLSALELPSTEATLFTVAERLQRYGALDRAIWIYEYLCETADWRPQPLRGLALALAQRASKEMSQRASKETSQSASRGSTLAARNDLARAVQLLNQVALTDWQGSFDGIELVALMEANALIPKLRRLGVERSDLDPRLVALLDVDLRILIEWNSPATDLDLWVEEPTGEQAMYSMPRTSLGGHLSSDMQDGYGPEEYLLRHARPGRYRVKVDVYRVDRINPNGVTTVTARLIRNFGRSTQREERIDLELQGDETGAVLVGEFVVPGGGRPRRRPE